MARVRVDDRALAAASPGDDHATHGDIARHDTIHNIGVHNIGVDDTIHNEHHSVSVRRGPAGGLAPASPPERPSTSIARGALHSARQPPVTDSPVGHQLAGAPTLVALSTAVTSKQSWVVAGSTAGTVSEVFPAAVLPSTLLPWVVTSTTR